MNVINIIPSPYFSHFTGFVLNITTISESGYYTFLIVPPVINHIEADLHLSREVRVLLKTKTRASDSCSVLT